MLPMLQQSLRGNIVGVAALVSDSSAPQAWWSELITDGLAPPGRFAHAAAGAGDTMYMVGGYAQGQLQLYQDQSLLSSLPQSVTADMQIIWAGAAEAGHHRLCTMLGVCSVIAGGAVLSLCTE